MLIQNKDPTQISFRNQLRSEASLNQCNENLNQKVEPMGLPIQLQNSMDQMNK